ncbi:hypothetical protein LJC45_04350 [Alistipes sp. OttesenSCG-928-B03]|nr:hypothetical protein [Alistipes sp. OttesenSCG-928-B03]
MPEQKRQYRQLSDVTKQKISQSLRGRSKSSQHVEKISQGLKSYWEQIPDAPDAENNSSNPQNDVVM